MRAGVKFMVLGVLLALCMGGTCRQETTQSVIGAFFTAIAQTTGQAIGDSLTLGNQP